MKDSISKRDWETISAYLDGQLSQQKQTRLESRLNNDRQLQVAFDELQDTRQVLHSAPRLRLPRDFMLTPEMAGNPIRMPLLAPVFGWASAVASFLLVLVLVGDFIGGGELLPIQYNISQQNESAAQRSQIAESAALEQPSVTEELSLSLKNSVGSAEEAALLEKQDDVVPMDIAAEPTLESAPMEEAISESQEIEMSADSEEHTPEKPEGRAAVTIQGDATFDSPSETPSEGRDDGSGEPQEVQGADDNLAEDTVAPQPEEPDSEPQQPTEMPVTEEISAQTLEDQPELPPIDVAETPTLADAKVLSGEQLVADVAETSITVEPTIVVAVNDNETAPAESTVPTKTRDMVFGIEVILALGALGTGLAWVYIRRRAG